MRITSPNYPNGYGDNQKCSWSVWAEEGQIIEVTIVEFEKVQLEKLGYVLGLQHLYIRTYI